MGRIPSEPAAIRRRIREHERKLRRDKHGYYDDGAGRRFLLAPLYLLAGDVPGALESFRWYEREFPGDGKEPGHTLCWALALHRGGDKEAAIRKLGQAMLCNRYLIPFMLGRPVTPGQFWEGSWVQPEDHIAKVSMLSSGQSSTRRRGCTAGAYRVDPAWYDSRQFREAGIAQEGRMNRTDTTGFLFLLSAGLITYAIWPEIRHALGDYWLVVAVTSLGFCLLFWALFRTWGLPPWKRRCKKCSMLFTSRGHSRYCAVCRDELGYR